MSHPLLRSIQPAAFISDESARPAPVAPDDQPADVPAPSMLSALLVVGGTIALVWGMFWIHAFGSSDCRIQPTQFVFGVTSEMSASVAAGVPCTIAIRPGHAVVDALSIDVIPKSGTVSARGRTGVIYHSRKNAPAPDEFAFSMHAGSNATAHQTSTIRVRTDAK